ncbi:putative conserved secreted protein [Synechococcus sp. RS9915]|nr:putative conserved secreted protein [Synechococcus sp. RS9915]
MIAHQGGSQQLVLVAVEFGKATSNLFVIFDERGRIINVDISRDFV